MPFGAGRQTASGTCTLGGCFMLNVGSLLRAVRGVALVGGAMVGTALFLSPVAPSRATTPTVQPTPIPVQIAPVSGGIALATGDVATYQEVTLSNGIVCLMTA